MDRRIKIGLVILGSVAVAGGLGYLIYRQVKKSKKQQEQLEAKEKKEKDNIADIQESEQQVKEAKTGNKVEPIRNIDKGINNAFNDIKGVKIYPARKSSDPQQGHPFAEGFATIRSSAEVNNSQGILDLWQNNEIGKVTGGGVVIGTIQGEKYDNLSPKMRWFNVKLDDKQKNKFGKSFGWVRSDVVTFKSFTKGQSNKGSKSGFDGNMIERYDTSYQLGAEVFPHSGWNLYSNVADADLFQNFDANQLDINL
jgi:hypothetical protein